MVKCPVCQFDNEDGALFCEQCKSDLASGAPVAAAPPATPAADAPIEVPPPMAAVVEEVPLGEPMPVAEIAADIHSMQTLPPDMPAAAFACEAPPAESSSAPAEPAKAETAPLPADAKPKLIVLRGQRVNVEYPLYEGDNFLGRADDDKAVDIDLEDQESPERTWASRQHAVIRLQNGKLELEDLNSTNGTYLNRNRVHPGQKKPLGPNDVIQIGTVQMRVKL
jgi:hypothetical protein